MNLVKILKTTLKVILLLFASYGVYHAVVLALLVMPAGGSPSEKIVGAQNVVPAVIIGSGPAGLVAAKTILEEGIPVIILEGKQAGGPLNAWTPVANWLTKGVTSGKFIISDLRAQVQAFPQARFIARSVESVDFSGKEHQLLLDNGEKLRAHTVTIAMGTRERKLTISGAQEFASAISYEQRPPACQKKGRSLVVGGGIDAIRKALYRAYSGATVTLIVRGTHLRGGPERKQALNDLVKQGKLRIMYANEVTELLGNKGTLTGARLSDGTVLSIDHVAVGIGREPNTKLFAGQLDLAKDRSINLKGHTQATNRPGIFAAGDITGGGYAECLIAAGDGMKAGKDVIAYLAAITL